VGDDRLRPLTPDGWKQSALVAERLVGVASPSLVSSPFLRCMQTLQPLADLLATTVQPDERLAEDTGFAGALELVTSLPDGAVLCSHGDVIPDVIRAIERRGCTIVGGPQWAKASVWALARVDGEITSATAWPPPSF
jgi:8-oxo-dGTP diphosphatase